MEWSLIDNKGFILMEAIGSMALLSIFCTLLLPVFMNITSSIEELKEEREVMVLLHEYVLLEKTDGQLSYTFPVTVHHEQNRYCAEWTHRRTHKYCLHV
ncbi:competence type IV pilus minor pilin ComGE [Salimicrobium halophilum]|uniref:competence type IV pilus minor pilin ComGE n=1 Tax=Salimicrobium halophilum TaxID=86666 RepID=UPI00389A1E7E